LKTVSRISLGEEEREGGRERERRRNSKSASASFHIFRKNGTSDTEVCTRPHTIEKYANDWDNFCVEICSRRRIIVRA